MSFKKDDRVVAYDYVNMTMRRFVGTVREVKSDGSLLVRIPSECHGHRQFHPKQCRKLKAKQRRRIWINASKMSHVVLGMHWSEGEASEARGCDEGIHTIEFLEVVRKP